MKTSAQSEFQGCKRKSSFGGELLKKKINRHARPVSTKVPMHLVLRSTVARGAFSLGSSKNLQRVNDAVRKHCERYGVKIVSYSNNFNHLHLIVKFPSRAVYLRLVRTLSSAIAMLVTGASKVSALSKHGVKRFWDRRPYTRIIEGYKNLKIAIAYVRLNQLEAGGLVPKRDGRLRDVLPHEYQLF